MSGLLPFRWWIVRHSAQISVLPVRSFYRNCENVLKKKRSFMWVLERKDVLRDEASTREIKLFKSMVLDEGGNLVFVVVGAGSEMFSSRRKAFI